MGSECSNAVGKNSVKTNMDTYSLHLYNFMQLLGPTADWNQPKTSMTINTVLLTATVNSN